MTESQRHHAILELLQTKRHISVADVITAFAVSPATARRDINKLNDNGQLRKVRNGAEVVNVSRQEWTPLNIRQASHLDEKIRITKAAAALCKPGESVVINCGSTAFLLGQELCGKDVQVITNYLPLANYLIDHEHERVVIIGGQYNKQQSITLAPQSSEADLYAGHWMFTSGVGLTGEGLYKTDMLSAMSEQKVRDHVGKLVVLVDSSKIGQRAGMLFSRAADIDMVITGKQADARVTEQLRTAGVDVRLV